MAYISRRMRLTVQQIGCSKVNQYWSLIGAQTSKRHFAGAHLALLELAWFTLVWFTLVRFTLRLASAKGRVGARRGQIAPFSFLVLWR